MTKLWDIGINFDTSAEMTSLNLTRNIWRGNTSTLPFIQNESKNHFQHKSTN